jgi:hypothetical protein
LRSGTGWASAPAGCPGPIRPRKLPATAEARATAGKESGNRDDDRPRRQAVPLKLETQLRFERLIADLTARFVNVAPEDLDVEVEDGLGRSSRL